MENINNTRPGSVGHYIKNAGPEEYFTMTNIGFFQTIPEHCFVAYPDTIHSLYDIRSGRMLWVINDKLRIWKE